ncbi:MAG: FAD-dependent oxidoreductase [bacterium]|nr:FAD-dependent oxidoreductase [bacterium]
MSKRNVIIGGGPAAINAIETIRQTETEPSQITIVSNEPAHSRMALPYWLCGNIPREHTYTADASWYEKMNVAVRIPDRVMKVDTQQQTLQLESGDALPYDQLLIATGSSPTKPPIKGVDLPGVHTLWSLADTEAVLKAGGDGKQPRVVLIGAGFIGFIVLNAMHKQGWQLTVIERESQVLPRMLDEPAARFAETWLERRSVRTITSVEVKEIRQVAGGLAVDLAGNDSVEADIVIVATGIHANTQFIEETEIEVEQGVLVDAQMRTSVKSIFAAGDVAQGPVMFSDAKEVHAIQPTAVDQGRIAGANMAGGDHSYRGSFLMNVVDVCGLQTASYGNWNEPTEDVTVIHNPQNLIYRKFLWRDDQIVGAIFTGPASDVGMLTDLGMVKGIMQTQTKLGVWKEYLKNNPYDVRRAYIGAGVAQKLMTTTLLGKPSKPRSYRFQNAAAEVAENPAHDEYVGTKSTTS